MNSKILKQSFYLFISILFYTSSAFAQRFNSADTTGFFKKIVTTRGKYTLVFVNREPSFDMNLAPRLIDLFFKVYPKEAKEYNHDAVKTVFFVIDPSYTRTPAATWTETTRFSPTWFSQHPEDIDCATHELMHVVQGYDFSNYGRNESVMPVWLVEGICDYVRYQFGIENIPANWTLPAVSPNQSYRNSYRVTARFFIWLKKHKDKHIVKQLDKALRDGNYNAAIWTKLTGETVDQLWNDYETDPTVELKYDTNS